MKKRFNTTGICVSRKHYMVDISDKLKEIKELLDITKAVKIINEESNTLFESIVKNLENNSELYELTKKVLI
ncbi:MAG: hypothetical protein ACRC68_16445, partial [Clostridium sp.]